MKNLIGIIDDEVEMRDLLKTLISETFDVNTQTFENLDEFLDNGELDQYGLVLSDVHMPSGSGLRLSRELKELNKNIPVIYISGFVDLIPPKEDIVILRKPINNEELFKYIKSYLKL